MTLCKPSTRAARDKRKAIRALEARAKREVEQIETRLSRVALLGEERKEKGARLKTLLQKEPGRLLWISNIEVAIDALDDEIQAYQEGIALNKRDLANFAKEIAKLKRGSDE